MGFSSEAEKWRHIVAPYCRGNCVEIGSGGSPVVPNSVQIELPEEQYAHYNSNHPPRGAIQWRSAHALTNLPFKDRTVDTLISSHLLEDVLDWWPTLREWTRVLTRPGGRLVICLPDKERWNEALRRGQSPNCAHRHESYVGELTTYALPLGLKVVADKFTDVPEGDYNIFFCGETI